MSRLADDPARTTGRCRAAGSTSASHPRSASSASWPRSRATWARSSPLTDTASQVFPDTDVEGGRVHAVRIVYRVRITGGELRDEVDGSTDTCAWFSSDEAARLHLGDLARRVLAMAIAGD